MPLCVCLCVCASVCVPVCVCVCVCVNSVGERKDQSWKQIEVSAITSSLSTPSVNIHHSCIMYQLHTYICTLLPHSLSLVSAE